MSTNQVLILKQTELAVNDSVTAESKPDNRIPRKAHYHLDPPLIPHNGHVLRVICITRISTLNQDPKSLDDQQALLKQSVAFLVQLLQQEGEGGRKA